ncbi:hypothetical protein KY331_01835 [Candidatus Woesearchaeota archaeon]|nr:hypothetical protein [Candidatus Woesearchaeota archaeon]
MKKSISILLMAIFVVSLLPVAIAEQESPLRARYQVQVASGNATNADANQTRATLRERFQNATPTTIQRIQTARERYQLAKERYLTARQRYQATKLKIQTAKTALSVCRDSESEKCVNIKQRIRAHSGEFLDNIADRVLATLDKIKSKVESNEDLTQEEMQDILSRIDAKIQEVTDAKDVIENLDNESTAEEIKEAARTIKQAWTRTRSVLKRSVGRLIGAKIGGIIVRAEHLETKLTRIVARLEEAGNDVSDIEDLMEKFNESIEEAKDKWELAKEKYAQAVTPGEVDELMKEVNQYLREAHEKLKESHRILKEIMKTIREKRGAQEAITAAETQSPVDVEEPEANETATNETQGNETE